MRFILSLALAVCAALPSLAQTRTGQPVLVELFTSQGCASCPPADAFLHQLAARDDVIALALHVDYWDYIGWKDVFADPANGRRQRAYADVAGRDMVYTPQIIVNGTDHVVGSRVMDVNDLIRRHHAQPGHVALSLSRQGDELSVEATATGTLPEPLVVSLARLAPDETVSITHGENAGRKINYANIVRSMSKLADWNPSNPLGLTSTIKGDAPIVVIVQRRGPGAVEAAALLR